MPNVENSRVGCPYDFNVGPHVLAIEHHIFTAPTNLIKKREFERSTNVAEGKSIKNLPNNFLVEATDFQEIRPILAGHSVAEITPEPGVPWYH